MTIAATEAKREGKSDEKHGKSLWHREGMFFACRVISIRGWNVSFSEQNASFSEVDNKQKKGQGDCSLDLL